MTNDDPVVLRLSAVGHEDDALKIYVPAAYRDDLVETLEGGGASTTEMMEFSADTVGWMIVGVWALHSLGGFDGLAGLIRTFTDRHQHKSVTLKVGDTSVETSGLSAEEAEEAIRGLLSLVQEQQREADETWTRIKGETEELPGGE